METKSLNQNSISGDYIITEMNDKTITDAALKISFEGNSNNINGFGGCNSFFGTYTLQNNSISFSDIASSKKYCGKELGATETNFFSTLKTSNKIELIDNSLVFYNDNTKVLKAERITIAEPNKKVQTRENHISSNSNGTFITYKALSRSAFEYVQISKSGITVSQDRTLQALESYACKPQDWEALSIMLKEIDIENLDKLKVPIDKRLYDGAAHATLSIIKGDVEMMSPSFDHGTPPKKIEELVNKVLSMGENASRN
ncbi:META domain-containing protein [Winogradskyella sp.]|uniref:META domain-containing protein n=1 Tax=Winogradskyella sp. TaxID=1883156 RepID=UPI00260B032F|nr:META domain-containing protein [Winogradskyella sp.]